MKDNEFVPVNGKATKCIGLPLWLRNQVVGATTLVDDISVYRLAGVRASVTLVHPWKIPDCELTRFNRFHTERRRAGRTILLEEGAVKCVQVTCLRVNEDEVISRRIVMPNLRCVCGGLRTH